MLAKSTVLSWLSNVWTPLISTLRSLVTWTVKFCAVARRASFALYAYSCMVREQGSREQAYLSRFPSSIATTMSVMCRDCSGLVYLLKSWSSEASSCSMPTTLFRICRGSVYAQRVRIITHFRVADVKGHERVRPRRWGPSGTVGHRYQAVECVEIG